MNSIDLRLERLMAASRLIERRKTEYDAFYRQQMRALSKLAKLAKSGNQYADEVLARIARTLEEKT
jgi:hypothetical protein